MQVLLTKPREGKFPRRVKKRMKTKRFLLACLCVMMMAVAITGPTQGLPLPYYGTYIGGSSNDVARGISINVTDAYITGYTNSNNYPTTFGAYDTSHNGNNDVIVTKVRNLSSATYFSTYLGGSDEDNGYSIFVDSSGDTYVTGLTNSNNFPTTSGVYSRTYSGGGDVFVAKFNAAGSNLIYSTYLGGSDEDIAMSIIVDSSGYAYVTGQTYSSDFPTTRGAYSTTFGGGTKDAFVAKFDTSGGLVYSTFLGGSGYDGGNGIEVDSSGNTYITGFTRSSNFPTTIGCHDNTLNGMQDAFVTKLNSAGSSLIYSTYLGGTVYEHALGIELDVYNHACVTGMTDSSSYPTTSGAYDTSHNGNWDAFATIVNATGTGLLYSTFIGGSGLDWGEAVDYEAADTVGIYVTGVTQSSNFPTTNNTYDSTLNGTQDAFVTRISPFGGGSSDLVYSTYLGGSDEEHGYGIKEYQSHAFVTGRTESNDFPTSIDAMDQTHNGGNDVYVSRLSAP